jgi:hypothetical protein
MSGGMRRKNREKLPEIKEPPFYDEDKEYWAGSSTSPSRKRVLPKRRMGSNGGLPAGPSKHHDDPANTWHEWNPGEFKRSYPKNKQNLDWYTLHKYGGLKNKKGEGTDTDGWTRLPGPSLDDAKDNMKRMAAAKHAKKGEARSKKASDGYWGKKSAPKGKPDAGKKNAPPKKKGKK